MRLLNVLLKNLALKTSTFFQLLIDFFKIFQKVLDFDVLLLQLFHLLFMLEFLFLHFFISVLNNFIKRGDLAISLAYSLRKVLVLSLDALQLLSSWVILGLFYQSGDGVNRFYMCFSHREDKRHDIVVNENTVLNNKAK